MLSDDKHDSDMKVIVRMNFRNCPPGRDGLPPCISRTVILSVPEAATTLPEGGNERVVTERCSVTDLTAFGDGLNRVR